MVFSNIKPKIEIIVENKIALFKEIFFAGIGLLFVLIIKASYSLSIIWLKEFAPAVTKNPPKNKSNRLK